MDSKFQSTANTKAICIPNGSFYKPLYIDLHEHTKELCEQAQDNTTDGVADSLYDTIKNNDGKSAILNSSTEDENTAIEALRQLGNISICTKVQSSLSCLNCNMQLQLTQLESHALICEHYYAKCCNCSLTFYHKKYREHLPCPDHFSKTCKICGVAFDGSAHTKVHCSINEEAPNTKSDNDFVLDDSDETTFPVLNNIWDDYEIIDENFTVVAQEMTVHTSKIDGSIEHDINSLELSNNSNIVLPNNDLITAHICKQCNRPFKREKAFLSHLKMHSVLDFPCINCEETFIDQGLLSKHIEQCKNFKNSNSWNVPKTSFQKHACSYCEKAFTTKQKLHRHMWVHRKKAFTCEVCAACFEKQAELDMHRLSTHQSTTGYFCNECGKCFSSRQGLWEHNRIHGPANHQYKCEECSKAFSSRQGYLIHKRAHSDERPYGCRFCWKAFRDGGTLRKHERIHTGLRPHICPMCSKAFNQKVVLREHVRWIHVSNWKPNNDDEFECSLCDVTVAEKDDLCAHMVKHSDNLAVIARNKVSSDTKTTSVGNKCINVKIEVVNENAKHKCDLCDEQFLDIKQLANHVQMHI